MNQKLSENVMAKKHRRGPAKAQLSKCLLRFFTKTFVLCGVFLSPSFVGAVGDTIGCSSRMTPERYDKKLRGIQKRPDDRIRIYIAGIYGLCLNKIQEGMGHIQRAADMGHIQANKVMAEYYRTDSHLDGVRDRHRITTDQNNFDGAVHYYEQTAQLIESAPDYPKGVNKDQRILENKYLSSAGVFYWLPYLYYTGYQRALDEVLNSAVKIHYEDSLDILNSMLHISQACLNRPALSAWKERQQQVYGLLQAGCSAMRDFANTVFVLEQNRINASGKCSGALRECAQHQAVMDQIRQAENRMLDRLSATPPIF